MENERTTKENEMATQGSNASKGEIDVAKLSADIDTLKADLAALGGTLRELAEHGRDTAVAEGKRRVASVQHEAKNQLDHLHRGVDDLAQQARDTVHERPATALLVAAGIGILFGLLTARR
jgi:ElaB/YqjD/DUF883 family membrane-anchored ribosome-binding protein